MMLVRCVPLSRLILATAVVLLSVDSAATQEKGASGSESSAGQAATDGTPRVRLRYKYQPGETITYHLEQLVAIDTTIAGNHQKTNLRTKSVRSLTVSEADDPSLMRFTHVIDRVDMWSEVGGRQPVHWSSEQGDAVPPEYEHVAENIGKPISVITINSRGEIIHREDRVQHPDLGLGGITIPLPEEEITVGATWSQPQEVKVRLDDQRIKAIQTRELYRLEKVETGIATISIKTQILTPVDDPRVKSQIVQRISQGEIRFDVDAGRLVSKQLNWNEQVLGFSGAESNMKYLAQFTEQLAETPYTASRPGDR